MEEITRQTLEHGNQRGCVYVACRLAQTSARGSLPDEGMARAGRAGDGPLGPPHQGARQEEWCGVGVTDICVINCQRHAVGVEAA